MKLIKPSIEVLPINTDIFKRIETIGRVCVKSEDEITDESAMMFCKNRLKYGHTSIFNHGISYFKVSDNIDVIYLYRLLAEFPHIKLQTTIDYISYIAVPFRCFLDYVTLDESMYIKSENKYDNLEYEFTINRLFGKAPFNIISNSIMNDNDCFIEISESVALELCPDIVHVSVKFTTDRSTTHELVRHTNTAFMQESTRWCNYSKDKFDNEITFIKPFYVGTLNKPFITDNANRFIKILKNIEKRYISFTQDDSWTAQQASSILPNTLKSDIWVTATLKEWYGSTVNCTVGDISYEERKGIFPQRLHLTAHPQMIEVMKLVKTELDKLGYGQ